MAKHHEGDISMAEGAKLLCGGPGKPEGLSEGYFVQPTIFSGVTSGMRIAQEEIFGPVLCIMPYATEEEAVAIANDTQYGLASGVWTRDLALAHRMIERIRAGVVWVNTYRMGGHSMPFGGVKASGIGREMGIDALEQYTEVKSVWINTTSPAG